MNNIGTAILASFLIIVIFKKIIKSIVAEKWFDYFSKGFLILIIVSFIFLFKSKINMILMAIIAAYLSFKIIKKEQLNKFVKGMIAFLFVAGIFSYIFSIIEVFIFKK